MRWLEFAVLAFVLLVLAALIFPTGSWQPPPRRVPRVINEFSRMSASLKQFKVLFGRNPPSGLTLYESSDAWRADGQSRRLMKQLWPQFDFTSVRDFNNDGDTEDAIRLSGAECLVFFLGGIQSTDAEGEGVTSVDPRLTGFSKNPRDPFSIDNGSRDGPFFEFLEERLTDVDGDGFFEYRSSLPGTKAPYIYLSSYGGAGYRKDDCTVYLPGDARNPKNLYYKDKGFKVPYNSDSFQIICAGRDDQFGLGGHFEPEAIDELFVGDRKFEHDNITNFHSGTLGDTSEKKNWFGFKMMSVCLLLGVGFILLLIRSLRRSRSCLESESG